MTAIAVGSGIVCALCILGFMADVQGRVESVHAEELARYGGEQVEVCVATRDIAAGERLEYNAVETKLWVAGLLPDGAIRSSVDALGEIATSSILKGEVITSKRFEKTHGAIDIPAGKQAVSVPVKAVQVVGGTVQPGMNVDVYSSGDTTTTLLVKGVIVLDSSVGSSSGLTSSEAGWVTLAVNPEQIQEIIAASQRTTLYFAIPGDEMEGDYDDE